MLGAPGGQIYFRLLNMHLSCLSWIGIPTSQPSVDDTWVKGNVWGLPADIGVLLLERRSKKLECWPGRAGCCPNPAQPSGARDMKAQLKQFMRRPGEHLWVGSRFRAVLDTGTAGLGITLQQTHICYGHKIKLKRLGRKPFSWVSIWNF